MAANADPNTGYAVYLESSGNSVWGVVGGTSAAAPLWAGFAAIVNQATGHQVWLPESNALRAGAKGIDLRPIPAAAT